MIIDKFTKAVMTLLAVSLFMIALNPWIAPTKAYANWNHNDRNQLHIGLTGIARSIDGIDCSR
jgi:hypothetical protein